MSTYNTPSKSVKLRDVPLYRGIKAEQGQLICINTAHGFGVFGSVATTLIAIGVAQKTIDNTLGNDGDLTVPVKSGELYRFANSGTTIAAANRGALCYIVDAGSVALSDGGGTRSIAGVIEDVDTQGVWVRVGALYDALTTAASTAVSTLTTNLAKATTPGGASIVGLYDAVGKYTATTVEAALAEDADARRLAVNAAGNTIASAVVQHRIAVPSGVTGTVTTILDATFGKVLITDVHFVKAGSTGGASDTIKLTDGTHDITDSFALSTKAAGAIVRALSISPTYGTVAAGGTLVANYTNGTTSCEGTLYVTGLRVA
jgi:hypothetical protein